MYEAFVDEETIKEPIPFDLQDVSKLKPLHIIGAGPAGLFAALEAIHQGLKPIVFERGKDVRARRRDLAALNKEQVVNPESNYCFGEGGAGTYSDGKLYTRSKKRGDVKRILAGLVQFGADENIRIEAHPHIGTNKLPQIIVEMREAIVKCGGEVNFDKKLTDIFFENDAIQAIEINGKEKIEVENIILATGHSARDIFELLNTRKIEIKAKPFAMGVRVEHPQELINHIQYHQNYDNELLPPAAYKIVKQVSGKGVYSFCMCPGGIIAPCATAPNEIVTNGWSPSKRNNPYANSGIVVTIDEEDWSAFAKYGELAALKFQEDVEQRMFQSIPKNAGQQAPARLDQVLPSFVAKRLQKAFDLFGKSMRGYLTNEAVIVGVESRTSSPVSIPRDRETMQHTQLKNLYPVGEGAGYAGGIVSAAIDGMKAVEKIAIKSVL
jgi:uncharacterized FAD-dependent dehydrogenase